MAQQNESNINVNLLIIGGLAIAGLVFGSKVLSAILPDEKKKKEEEEKIKAAINADVFNDDFQKFITKCFTYAKQQNPKLYAATFYSWCGFNPYSSKDQAKVQQQAQWIYGAKASWMEVILTVGVVTDNDNTVLGIIQQAPTQVYISALNQSFFNQYSQSMIDYCNSFMDSANVARIEDIINKKPLYKK